MRCKKPKKLTPQQETNKRIGQRLKRARSWKSMSQADVARDLKMSRGRWSMYENGQRTLSVYVMIEFSKLVEVDLHYIICGETAAVTPTIRQKQKEAEIEEKAARSGG